MDADESSLDSSASRLLTFAKIAKSHSLPRCVSQRHKRGFSLLGYFQIYSKSRKVVSLEPPSVYDCIKSKNLYGYMRNYMRILLRIIKTFVIKTFKFFIFNRNKFLIFNNFFSFHVSSDKYVSLNKKLNHVENPIVSLVIESICARRAFVQTENVPGGRKKVKAIPRRVLAIAPDVNPYWDNRSEGRSIGERERANVDLRIGATFSRHRGTTRGPTSRSKIRIGALAKRREARWRRKSALFRVVALRGEMRRRWRRRAEAASREQRPKERKDVGAEETRGESPEERKGHGSRALGRAHASL